MKNGKKITAVAAASAVASALVAPAAMAATTFTDIQGNFAADAINALAAKGILNGNPDGTFNPNGNITREQFAIVLAKALNLDASATDSFTDVDSWAAGYVAAVNKAGLVAGYDATHFGGKDQLTREQMATILVRALTKEQGYDATGKAANLTFSDASSISSWAKDSVGAAVELGLIHGMPDGTFAPAANATRAQVALVTQAFMNVQVNNVSVTASATLNSDNTATVTGTTKGGADSVKVTVDGGTAMAATLNADGSYTFNTSVLAAGSHTISVVAYKGTTASQPASATVTVATVGVASVKATDPTHVDVVFNTPMDTNDVAKADFAITANGATGNLTDSVSWSADGKTATLNLLPTAPLVNNTYYTVTVKQTVQDANANVISTSADYNSGFLWNDTTAPTVTGIKNALGGAVEIDFSKPLTNTVAPTIVVNGTPITVTTSGTPTTPATAMLNEGDTSITIPANVVSGIASVGSTLNVIVSGAQDQADTDATTPGLQHNTMSLYQGSLTYSLNAVTPVVQSVTAVAENQFTVTFNEPIAAGNGATVTTDGKTDNAAALGLQVVNSDGLAVNTTNGYTTSPTATTTDGQTFTVTVPTDTLSVKYPNGVYLNGASTANLNVTVSGFQDSGNDLGASTTKAVTLNQDLGAPTLINTQVDSTTGDVTFTFNKDIVKGSGAITAVDNSTGVAVTLGTPVYNGKTVTVPAMTAGTYSINFAADTVEDTTLAANENAAFSKVVTVPSTTSTNGPAVDSASATVVSSANVITVAYNDAVKGGAQAGSATDVNNYKLNGAALPAGSTITLNAGTVSVGAKSYPAQTVATITLPSGTVASTATEVLTVSNVQTLDGLAVATFNGTVGLADNTAPTLTAAKVDVSGNLVLTFSEDVDGMGDEASPALLPSNFDFAITVNGVSIDPSKVTVNKGTAETQVSLTASGVSFASGNVVVKTSVAANHTMTTKDAAGNLLATGTSVTATR